MHSLKGAVHEASFLNIRFDDDRDSNLKHIDSLCSFYELDSQETQSQYEMLICYDEVKSCQTAYEVLKMLRKSSLHLVYPNLYLLYRLMATIPVTTASCEHSFSKLSLIKPS